MGRRVRPSTYVSGHFADARHKPLLFQVAATKSALALKRLASPRARFMDVVAIGDARCESSKR